MYDPTVRQCVVRRGFTLVELLVVIGIIGLLVALLIPAVGGARERMRKLTCLNNMKEIGKAIIAFESAKQRYPGYIEPVKAIGNSGVGFVQWVPGVSGQEFVDSGSEVDSSFGRSDSRVSLFTHILPYVDGQDIWDVIVDADAPLNQRALKRMQLYVCPTDTDVTGVDGSAGLTYVLNTGSWDWTSGGNFLSGGNQGDTKQNGMFHNLVEGGVRTRLTDMRDGASTTMMLSENIQKNPTYSWFGVAPGNPGEQQFGMVWVVNTQPATPCQNNRDQARIGFEPDTGALNFPETTPCYARPTANHPGGGFNVVFADAHGAALTPDIDYIVYQQLLTPHGAKCVDPTDHNAFAGAIQAFRTAPPLSAADYE